MDGFMERVTPLAILFLVPPNGAFAVHAEQDTNFVPDLRKSKSVEDMPIDEVDEKYNKRIPTMPALLTRR